MKDKELLRLISEYVEFTNDIQLKNTIYEYIIKNYDNISKEDLKKASLVFLKYDMFDFVNCNKYEQVINNIDNTTWLDDEDNYL